MDKRKLLIPLAVLLLGIVAVSAFGGFKTLFEIDDKGKIGLCSKDTTTWECTDDVKGEVKYQLVGDKLYLDVKAGYLPCDDKTYQLTLNGDGNNVDGSDDKLGSACPNPNTPAPGYEPAWECGTWGSEGFYNFEMEAELKEKVTKEDCKYEKVKKCKNITKKQCKPEFIKKCYKSKWTGREYCYNRRVWTCEPMEVEHCWWKWDKVCTPGETKCYLAGTYEVELDKGVYEGIKFLIKEGDSPWTPVAMETEQMNFAIV